MNDDEKNEKKYITFPCEFYVKVIGKASSDIRASAAAIINKHCESSNLAERFSQSKEYISLTFTIQAKSKKQLDAIYKQLSSCKDVLMAL